MKNKKILFVTSNGIVDSEFGGPKGSIRNYNCMQRYGEVFVYTIKKKSNILSLCSLMEGYYPPISYKDKKQILNIIKNKNIEIVFFDGSIYGGVVAQVKMKNCFTISFCHNCEWDYNSVRFGKKKSLKKWIYGKSIYKNEKIALKNSDRIITFLNRDSERITELYGVNSTVQIPLTIEDKASGVFPFKNKEKRICLLFGPAQSANIDGFSWFAKEVSPHLKCKTVIAGKGFDKYKRDLENQNVQVIGYVKDLVEIYENTSIVAIPLFSGGGMKVKTVEALMFGKYIVGTTEAFEGYNLDFEKVGGICNDAPHFIKTINSILEKKEFNNYYSRNMYLEKYSIEASFKEFDKLIGGISNDN